MRVLYANPIFLDYRISFYKHLIKLFQGEFYILYSVNRYKGRFDDLLKRIPKELGINSIPYNQEKTFYCNNLSFKYKYIDKCSKQLPFAIPFAFGLLKKIHEYKPDVLITEGFAQWTPLLCLYAWRHQIPLYMGYERTLHTERAANKIKIVQRKWVDRFITGYLVNGSETRKYLLSLGVKNEKIFAGGMNADSTTLKRAIASFSMDDRLAFKKKYQENDKGIIFLFSGQMITRKGVGHLLESWIEHIKRHTADKLILIGGGPLYEQYKRRYIGIPSIYLEGRVAYQDVYKYYSIADVFILPTIEDNWSLVIPEAMACGLPVATSIYNGCYPELVQKDVNGITFDTYQHDTIVEALDYFHFQNLEVLGKNSIILEEPFNTENSAQRVFDAIIGNMR